MIFVDTSFFLAVFSVRDQWHQKAVECLDGYQASQPPSDLFLTTNHVLFETVTVVRSKAGHALAVSACDDLQSGQMARVHHATDEEERAALEYLKKCRDQDYSPVDCLSFVIMEKLGIREALSFDDHFTHRFIVRPGR